MKIVIVDDDKLVALSLKTILEATGNVEVIEMGVNGLEAIELYEKYNPDVLLMDIRMEKMTGLEATEEIIKKHPEAKILLLTTFNDDEYIIKAIRYGAKGYILKQAFESIAPALLAVYNGQTVFGDEVMEKLPSLMGHGNGKKYEDYGLTEKEFQIVSAVADGLNNKEIAEKLFLSEGTVRNYLSAVLEKLELRDRTQLACFYYKNF